MTLTVALPDERTATLAAKAKAHGLSTEEYVGRCYFSPFIAPSDASPDMIPPPPFKLCPSTYALKGEAGRWGWELSAWVRSGELQIFNALSSTPRLKFPP